MDAVNFRVLFNLMKPQRLLLATLIVLQPMLLSGCVAAAVPVMAGSLVMRARMDGKPHKVPKGGHRGPSTTTSGQPPAPEAAGTALRLTELTALPRPDEVPDRASEPFSAFARFALAAARTKPGQPLRSALIDPTTLTSRPARSSCGHEAPAVLIDLDPGKGAFDLDDPPAAAPHLAEQLAILRAAGLAILWQTSLPADAAERLHVILTAVGLDPDRADRLLLVRRAGERKQDRRQQAAREWCILAIAGDTKGDFEEAFDYLRDPDGPLAAALSANLGDGWFLTAQPVS